MILCDFFIDSHLCDCYFVNITFFVHFLLWFYRDANNAMEHLKSVGYKVNYGYKKTRPNIASGSQNNADNNNPPPSNENGSPLTGQCTNCGKLAFRTCARCGDFYCSESCQASNWHSHKRNCFVMP